MPDEKDEGKGSAGEEKETSGGERTEGEEGQGEGEGGGDGYDARFKALEGKVDQILSLFAAAGQGEEDITPSRLRKKEEDGGEMSKEDEDAMDREEMKARLDLMEAGRRMPEAMDERGEVRKEIRQSVLNYARKGVPTIESVRLACLDAGILPGSKDKPKPKPKEGEEEGEEGEEKGRGEEGEESKIPESPRAPRSMQRGAGKGTWIPPKNLAEAAERAQKLLGGGE